METIYYCKTCEEMTTAPVGCKTCGNEKVITGSFEKKEDVASSTDTQEE